MKINLNQDFSDYIYNRVSNKIFNEKEKGVTRIKHWNEKKYFRKKNSYKVFMRILNKFIGLHHDDAFSYYCSIESDREKRELFLGHLNFVITHTVYRYYRTAGFKYQIVDGIILRTVVEQKPRTIKSLDYAIKTTYVDQKTGLKCKERYFWLNPERYKEVREVISGRIYHFDSKNNYLYKRTWKEKEQAKLKAARNEIKVKVHPNDIKYIINESWLIEKGVSFKSSKEANQFLFERGLEPSQYIVKRTILYNCLKQTKCQE